MNTNFNVKLVINRDYDSKYDFKVAFCSKNVQKPKPKKVNNMLEIMLFKSCKRNRNVHDRILSTTESNIVLIWFSSLLKQQSQWKKWHRRKLTHVHIANLLIMSACWVVFGAKKKNKILCQVYWRAWSRILINNIEHGLTIRQSICFCWKPQKIAYSQLCE